MRQIGVATTPTFLERNWTWLALAAPIGVYTAWMAAMVVPQVVRVVVPELVRTIVGH
jgi:hypothetical protein